MTEQKNEKGGTHFSWDLDPLGQNGHVWFDKEHGGLDHSVRSVLLDLMVDIVTFCHVDCHFHDVLGLQPLLEHVLWV